MTSSAGTHWVPCRMLAPQRSQRVVERGQPSPPEKPFAWATSLPRIAIALALAYAAPSRRVDNRDTHASCVRAPHADHRAGIWIFHRQYPMMKAHVSGMMPRG